jgi:outer membrane protein, multidrug efflux system
VADRLGSNRTYLHGREDRRQVNVATAQQEQELNTYLMTIQTAFREVEDSLIATRKIREQQAAQDRQIRASKELCGWQHYARRTATPVTWKFSDAQGSWFNAELQQVQLQRARLGALVNLYKPLGGGWTP